MKNIKRLLVFITVLAAAAAFQACSEDAGNNTSTDLNGASFEKTISSYNEADGDGTVEIVVEDAGSDVEFEYTGTALEGVDYDVVGFANGVLTLALYDDDSLENNEYVRVRIMSGSGRNPIHTVNMSSDCEDVLGFQLAGDFVVVTDDWADYHAGDELAVEVVDATHLRVVDYPATAYDHVSMIITIDPATGEATVESQDNGSYNASGTQQTTTVGAGTLSSDPCGEGTVINLVLDFTLPCCGTIADNGFVLKKL